jgi:hypothetical protein
MVSVSAAIFSTAIQPAHADTPTVPTVVSFTMSPDSVDFATGKATVTFDLVVNNPNGIASTQTLVTLSDGGSNSIGIPIVRTDSPANNSLQTVEFKGIYNLGSNLPTGVYKATAAPIMGLNSVGTPGYPTQSLVATTTSNLVGGTNALLVRNGGYLNFAYSTFTGPAFNTLLGNKFVNPKYYSVSAPIWKVGETFNPSDYYELLVPSLTLKVKTTTPSICTSNGTMLSLLAVGSCDYIVYTDKTLDYQYKQDDQVVSVTASRTKPTFSVGTIPTQSSASLPLSIQGPSVYGPFGWVIPASATPTVCYPVGTYITIISGGTCTLNYSTPASSNYLASDITPLTFQISRAAQTISFPSLGAVGLANKTLALSATSSSGSAVVFQSDTPTICAVTGNSLSLLKVGTCQVQAIQNGTSTIGPVSASQSILITGASGSGAIKPRVKYIVCLKSGRSKTFVGSKCPLGYKPRK